MQLYWGENFNKWIWGEGTQLSPQCTDIQNDQMSINSFNFNAFKKLTSKKRWLESHAYEWDWSM